MMNKLAIRKEFLQVTQANDLIVRDIDSLIPADCITFPLADLASLGTVFSSLPAAFSSAAQAAGKGKVLYEATFPVAGKLAEAKDGSGFLGAIVGKKGVVGQARFHEVKGAVEAAGGTSMMFMALAILAINKSLKDISETQKEIISFLEIDKQTQLKGDLIILSEIIEDYQHNWKNGQYRSNREMQVLDIKRSAEQNILFYREMIEKKLGKQAFVHLDTTKTLNEAQSKFRYYKLALYLYAFSSFLDIMLLENFDAAYLNSIVSKIRNYSLEYDQFFKKSLESVEKYAANSLQARALQGIAIAGRFAGEQIAKIPDKDNKIKIDDKLISGSERLDKFHADAIKKTVDSFTAIEDSGIKMFSEKIQLINHMHNETLHIMFDSENLYLPVGSNIG